MGLNRQTFESSAHFMQSPSLRSVKTVHQQQPAVVPGKNNKQVFLLAYGTVYDRSFIIANQTFSLVFGIESFRLATNAKTASLNRTTETFELTIASPFIGSERHTTRRTSRDTSDTFRHNCMSRLMHRLSASNQ